MLIALVASVLVVGACSDDGAQEAAPSSTSTPQAAAQYNDADVAFATAMIPHHQQAVEMAELAADRAESPEVRQLAEDIAGAQEPEIQTMTQWLEDWGQETPTDSMDHGDMGHGDPEEMPGMMNESEMTQLEESDGNAFDQMFVQMMIEHHEGAIEMARDEQANGKHAEAVALAKKIESDQQAEIAKMKDF